MVVELFKPPWIKKLEQVCLRVLSADDLCSYEHYLISSRTWTGLQPWRLQCRCIALPVELSLINWELVVVGDIEDGYKIIAMCMITLIHEIYVFPRSYYSYLRSSKRNAWKLQAWVGIGPWPLQFRCRAPPIEQYEAWNFQAFFLLLLVKVASHTATASRIFYICSKITLLTVYIKL